MDYDLPPADQAFTPGGWQSQLDEVCRQEDPPREEGCLTVSLGDVDLPEGLTGLTFGADGARATDTATGEPVDVECFPVVVNPGGLAPGSRGQVEVGTNFVVDVECGTSGDTDAE